MNDPILCTGNELRSVLESLEKRGMFPWSLDTGVGGNAGYRVSYFKAFPNQPQDASSGTMQSEPDLARTVKGVRKVAGHNAQRNAAAGGGTRAEKPSIVTDEPASTSIEDRMAALKARLEASGRLRRSRYYTPAEHARLPHPDD